MKLIKFLVVIAYCNIAFSREIVIKNATDFANLPKLAGGDIVLVSSGEMHNVELKIKTSGKINQPIIIKAIEPNKTIFTGYTRIILDGEMITFDGFSFRNGGALKKEGVIKFEPNSKFCRITNCSFEDFNLGEKECNWIFVQGFSNRIDHSYFKGKSTLNALIFVKPDEKESQINEPRKHKIDHNYFGLRDKIGSNGYETLRIGDSKTQQYSMQCLVEFNHFYQSIKSDNAGEMEVISNKSSDNVYRFNVFQDCDGQLTLRHGQGCLVEYNLFLGTNSERQSGVRVIGINHTISGNLFYNLGGKNLRASLVVMGGIYGDNKSNKYEAVENCTIKNNIFINCKEPINIGISKLKDADAPRTISFMDNTIILFNDKILHKKTYSKTEFQTDFFSQHSSLKNSINITSFKKLSGNKILSKISTQAPL